MALRSVEDVVRFVLSLFGLDSPTDKFSGIGLPPLLGSVARHFSVQFSSLANLQGNPNPIFMVLVTHIFPDISCGIQYTSWFNEIRRVFLSIIIGKTLKDILFFNRVGEIVP